MIVNYQAVTLNDGKLKLHNKQQFENMKANLPSGPYVMVFMSMSEKDTRDCQNRYFAQLGEWSQSVGERKEWLHEMVKEELFVNLFGEPHSTTELTPEQWTIVFFNLENFLLRKYENK